MMYIFLSFPPESMRTTVSESATPSGNSSFRQERRRVVPVFVGRHPIVFVADARGILRGRDERAVPIYKFHKIQPVILRRSGGIVNVERLIRPRPRQIDRHFQRDLGVGDVFHLAGDLIATLRVFFVELRDERFAALCVRFFERGLRVVRHAVGHQRNRSKHGDREKSEIILCESSWLCSGGSRPRLRGTWRRTYLPYSKSPPQQAREAPAKRRRDAIRPSAQASNRARLRQAQRIPLAQSAAARADLPEPVARARRAARDPCSWRSPQKARSDYMPQTGNRVPRAEKVTNSATRKGEHPKEGRPGAAMRAPARGAGLAMTCTKIAA